MPMQQIICCEVIRLGPAGSACFPYRRRRVESAAADEPLVAAADVASPTWGAKASGSARMQSY